MKLTFHCYKFFKFDQLQREYFEQFQFRIFFSRIQMANKSEQMHHGLNTPANNYMFKVNNENTRTSCKIC